MWKEIEKEDIVNVDEGTKMRIGGCECVFFAYDEDYEFYVEDETLPDGSSWMEIRDWYRWTVEVWEESETVTTTPPEFKDMKFRVRDEEHSKQIQETLFGLGYKWATGEPGVNYTYCQYLYTNNDGDLCYGTTEEFFDGKVFHKEHTIKPVEGFEIVPVEPKIPVKKMTKEEI